MTAVLERRRRRRTKRIARCGKEVPVGTIVLRENSPGQERRYIKVRHDGPPQKRWILLARWTWEQTRGPVPPGKRVVHLDGNSLNDNPDNYATMTGGEWLNHLHKIRPGLATRNRVACSHGTQTSNRLRARILRATRFLPSRWYIVDHGRRVIVNNPQRGRHALLALLDLPCVNQRNGAIGRRHRRELKRRQIAIVRGREIASDPTMLHYERVDRLDQGETTP